MKKIITTLLLTLTSLLATAQITINKSIFTDADKCLILVSDEDGDIIFESLMSVIPTDDYTFYFKRDYENQLLNLTIIMEQNKRYLPIFQACSYYNIPDTMNISNNDDFQIPEPPSFKEPDWLFIKIKNVFSQYDTYIPITKNALVFQKIRRRRGKLKIRTYKFEKQDFFLLSQCNDEDEYRYLYIPYNKLKGTMIYNWDDLSTELTHKFIPSPPNAESVMISGQSEFSDQNCILFSEKDLTERDSLDLLLPKDIDFSNYYISYDAPFYESPFKKASLQTTLYDIEDISNTAQSIEANHTSSYTVPYIDTTGFEIDFLENDVDFIVTYQNVTVHVEQPYKGASRWTILGTAEYKTVFTFPLFLDEYFLFMPSLSNFNNQALNQRTIKTEQYPKNGEYYSSYLKNFDRYYLLNKPR